MDSPCSHLGQTVYIVPLNLAVYAVFVRCHPEDGFKSCTTGSYRVKDKSC